MAPSRLERILVLAKTYPSPSAQYIETSCVAGITEDGSMRRLYPVPFRLIDGAQQFKKWQWIEARVEKASRDHRPESHRLFVDTLECGAVIDTKNAWNKRREWLEKIPSFIDLAEIEDARSTNGISLALLHPSRVLALEISPARNVDWTEEEKEKLMREHMQGDLFSEADAKRQLNGLRKVPFDFHYHYECETRHGTRAFKTKIVDWEAGALYWNCRKSHGERWQEPFRAKLEQEFATKDLMFLMGNQHRFPHQWLIISLIYPPTRELAELAQASLL